MREKRREMDWCEGRSGIGIPMAIFSGMALVASLPLRSFPLASFAIVGIGLGSRLESGCTLLEDNRLRSWMGWGGLRWGRWYNKPVDAEWGMLATKQSTTNRRGSPNAVGIMSWELGWFLADGEWFGVHEFTKRSLAQNVATFLQIDVIRCPKNLS